MELNRSRRGGIGFVRPQEEEDRIPNPDLVAVGERTFPDRHAVNECAVQAVQIPDPEAVVHGFDQTVFSRQREVADGKPVGFVAADRHVVCRERDELTLQRAGEYRRALQAYGGQLGAHSPIG